MKVGRTTAITIKKVPSPMRLSAMTRRIVPPEAVSPSGTSQR
jgi:hypothetical protein